jgi:O-antigen ligase
MPSVVAVLRRQRATLSILVLLLVWLSLSVVWSQRPDLATAPLERWLVSAFIFMLVATTFSDRRHMRLLIGGFVVGAIASVIAGVASGGLHASTGAALDSVSEAGRFTGGVGDPNELAQGLVPAIVLAAALLGVTRKRSFRFAVLIGIAAMTVGVAATESRGGVIALIVAVIGSLVLQKGYRRQVLAVVVLVSAAAAVWFSASPGAWHRVTTFGSDGTGRSELWRVAWYITQDHPIVGVGLNNYPVHAPDYVLRPGGLQYVRLIAQRPHQVHNIYLQALAETGVIGLVLLLSVLGAALRTSWLAARRFEQLGDRAFAALSRAVLVGSLSFLAASFFLTNGFDSRLWLLLGMGPALLAAASNLGRLAPRA